MIHTLTLNPAIDRVLFLDVLRKNVTNRIRDLVEVLGGKGTHVSINLRLMGLGTRAFGVCHGATGRRIMDLLGREGVELEFIHREGAESRTNYLLVEEGDDCTIVAEKGVPLDTVDLEEVTARLLAKTEAGDSLVLSGDAGNCPDPFVYKSIMAALAGRGLRFFVDTSGPALAKCLEASPYLIKPNLAELSFLCGREVGEDEGDLVAALASLEGFGVEVVAVSLGASGSILKAPGGIWRARPPAVKVRNTIGCGDCFLAGLVAGIGRGLGLEETLLRATAASAATAESPLSVGFDRARAEELLASSSVTRIA